MKKKEMNKLIIELEKKQEALSERLVSLHKEKTREDNPLSSSNEEDNSQIFTADLIVDILDERDYRDYNLVKVALKKIKSGIYGECEECSEKIGVSRLIALPFAKYCIDCAESIELVNKGMKNKN